MEWEDQRWLPGRVRQGVTGYLNFVGNLSWAPYAKFADLLAKAMRATGDAVLLDLCSGSAGPLPMLLRLLEQRGVNASAVLTDLYPDQRALGSIEQVGDGRISYVREPVDASRLPPELMGFRILCNGFHHFRPHAAQGILADAVRAGRGVALIEVVERRVPAILACVLAVIAVPLATLFMRPWRWDRVLLTFGLPVIPLVTAWDGVVSCLRVYSPAELRSMLEGVPGKDGYVWHIQRYPVPRSPFGVTCLVGHPRSPCG